MREWQLNLPTSSHFLHLLTHRCHSCYTGHFHHQSNKLLTLFPDLDVNNHLISPSSSPLHTYSTLNIPNSNQSHSQHTQLWNFFLSENGEEDRHVACCRSWFDQSQVQSWRNWRFLFLFFFTFWLQTMLFWILIVGLFAAPDITGIWLRIFVMLLEMPLIGSVILSYLKKQNKIQEVCLLVFY